MTREDSLPDFPPEHRGTYRTLLKDAFHGIRTAPGSERTYGCLIKLELWMGEVFGQGQVRVPDDLEAAISKTYRAGRGKTRTINDLLGLASERITRLLDADSSPEDLARTLAIVLVRDDRTLLPPGEGGIRVGSGNGMEKREYAPRLQALIELLHRHQIFTDDLILTVGKNLPTMMRGESYTLVEIPRLRRDILLCNEVGEATFVSERPLGKDCYLRSTKEDLHGYPGIHRIIFNNPDQWERDLTALLFREGEPLGQKINVRNLQEMRNEILKTCTSDQWVKMKNKGKLAFRIHGKGLNALATIFGIEGNPVGYHSVHLELGAMIFGGEDPVIKPLIEDARVLLRKHEELGEDPEKWRGEIQKTCTPGQWVKMEQKEKHAFHVHGKGLNALARIFGIEGNPVGYHSVHLELGARIFGEGDPVIKPLVEDARVLLRKHEELGEDPEKWRGEIQKICTPAQWVKMACKEKRAFRVHGKGLIALARLFGVEGNPANNRSVHLELGARIFGEEIMKKE